MPIAGKAKQAELDQHMSLMGWYGSVTGFFEVALTSLEKLTIEIIGFKSRINKGVERMKQERIA